MTLPNPESRKEMYLAKASGMTVENLPEPASREEQYLNAIAQGGGGGGTSDFDQLSNRPKYNGATMTGETNIPAVATYTDFVGTDGSSAGTHGLVPAPATTDAGKFLKADGTWAEAGGGGGGVTALTEADYNYPEENPQYLNLETLPVGIYYTDVGYQGLNYYMSGSTSSLSTPCTFIKCAGNVICILSDNSFKDKISYITENGSSVLLSRSDIIDNLTTDTGVRPLSARQGKVLNDKIEAL